MDDLTNDAVWRRDVADRVANVRNYGHSELPGAEYKEGWDEALCTVLDILYGDCAPDARIPSADA